MQAIQTRFLGPTNHRGARVVAWCDAGRLVVSWDHSLSVEPNHAAAASALRVKLDWPGDMVSGALPGGDYAHVFK
jgi:hypothetical protein